MPPITRHADEPGAAPHAPSDAPVEVTPFAEDAPHPAGSDSASSKGRDEVYLPGWLPVEQAPTAEQGPGD